MKTALVTTCHLDVQDYFDKTTKFIEYYHNELSDLKIDEIILIDNGTTDKVLRRFFMQVHAPNPKLKAIHFDEFLGRDNHLSYPYLWRAVYYIKNILKEYDKVIYMDNDFYITSSKLANYINELNSCWTTLWCPKHQFPETGIHIVTKDCPEYQEFVKSGNFMEHNGKTMETTLPVTLVNKDFKGDRWSEYPSAEVIPEGSDFSAQTSLNWKVKYDG